MSTLKFAETLFVGENDYGYQFGVGLLGDRWVGFALGRDGDGKPIGLFVLSGVAEGHTLGLADRDAAIRKTTAIACDPEAGYGGITRWFVAEALRGDPEAYRCEHCEAVDCPGDCCAFGGFDDFDPEGL